MKKRNNLKLGEGGQACTGINPRSRDKGARNGGVGRGNVIYSSLLISIGKVNS